MATLCALPHEVRRNTNAFTTDPPDVISAVSTIIPMRIFIVRAKRLQGLNVRYFTIDTAAQASARPWFTKSTMMGLGRERPEHVLIAKRYRIDRQMGL